MTLGRWLLEVSGDQVGPSVIEWLTVGEVDERGRLASTTGFDLDDLDAAYAELDRRWKAGDAAAHLAAIRAHEKLLGAIADRDWDALAASVSPDFRVADHRRLGWGSILFDPATFVESQRALFELAPDYQYRTDHLRTAASATLSQIAQLGTRDGGPFENVLLWLGEVDEQGRYRRFDLYDLDQVDQALARFAELADAGDVEPFANAAWRADEQIRALWMAREWQRIEQALPARFRYLDRRRGALLDLDGRQYVEFIRLLGDMESTRIEYDCLATRGERLALGRMRIHVAGGDVGPSELENVSVFEVDDHGEPIALVRFDPDDLDAAFAELDARWEAGEAAAHPAHLAFVQAYQRAVARRDWAPVLARMCGPTFIEYDHRRLAVLGTTHGAEAWVRSFRALTDLAPDSIYRVEHFRSAARGFWCVGTWHGSRDGGAYELPINAVIEMDDRDLVARADIYDLDQLDQASTRFAELAPATPHDPLARIARPNAAHAALQRWLATYAHAAETGDWTPMQGLLASGFAFEDGRPLFRLSGGSDLFMAANRERLAIGARPRLDLLGTAGGRIAIERVLWSGGPPDGPFEIEYVVLWEVDERGQIAAALLFDADDTVAARREAWRRWTAIDPSVAEMLALVPRMVDAFNAHDEEALRATAREDCQLVDRRRTGMGRLDADAYGASVRALWSLAPTTRVELGWHWLASGPHGGVTVARRYGGLKEGGAYESEGLVLYVQVRGSLTHVEFFEMDDLEAALARFAELRPCGDRPESQTG